MGGFTLKELFRQLSEGTVAPVYYLTGDEEVLKDEAVDAIVDHALDAAERQFNFDQRRASELDQEAFHALVETPPLLTSRRVVVIRGVEAWKRKTKLRDLVRRYLKTPAPETVLVLVSSPGADAEDTYADRAVTLTIKPLAPPQVRRWLTHRANTLGLEVDDEAAAHLAAACDGALSHIVSELDKITAATGGGVVTVDDIEKFVGVRRGETGGDFLDAVMTKNAGRAVNLVGPLLEQPGVTGVRMVASLGTALLGVRSVRAAFDGGARGRDLEGAARDAVRSIRGQKPVWSDVSRWARWASLWNDADLVIGLQRARETDRMLKSSGITDERGILRSLVLALGRAKEEAA